ncbi:hypothetical protein J6590_028274 [Homalodisca vitripennis]|nr:hypothetical protein J6590_028274 [Homalodisca vitripennis]
MLFVTFLQGGRVWEKNEWFLMGSIDPLRGSFIYNPIPLGHNDTSPFVAQSKHTTLSLVFTSINGSHQNVHRLTSLSATGYPRHLCFDISMRQNMELIYFPLTCPRFVPVLPVLDWVNYISNANVKFASLPPNTAANSAVKAKYQTDLYRLRLIGRQNHSSLEVCILADRIMPLSSSGDWYKNHSSLENNAALEFWRLVDRIMTPSRSADWSTESCRSRVLEIGRQNHDALEVCRLVYRIMPLSRSADWYKNHSSLEVCRLFDRIMLLSRSAHICSVAERSQSLITFAINCEQQSYCEFGLGSPWYSSCIPFVPIVQNFNSLKMLRTNLSVDPMLPSYYD